MDPKSGLITLKTSLDRELLGDWVNLTVRATDLGEIAQLHSDSIVSINILDENDNRPKFDAKEVFVSLQENSPIGFLITRVFATDPDLNSTMHYFILNKTNDSSQFLINKLTGDVFVNAKLDYEHKSQYVIEIGAVDAELNDYDEAKDASIKLVIDLLDVNDNEPQFDPSTPTDLFVEENLAINSTIYEFKAFDGDRTHKNSHFKFRIDSDLFGIEEHTGRLFTKAVFDYESNEIHDYTLKVECLDNGEPTPLKTQHVLNIHIRDTNDNAPRFARANQTIIFRETFPLGQELTKFSVSDLDSANHGGSPFTFNIMEQYRSLSDSSAELVQLTEPVFAINPNGSLILIKKPFSNQTYLAKVRCYDSGNPPLYTDTHLTIKVTDESSNEPVLNDTQIDILTIGSLDEFDSDLLVRVEPNGLVGEVKAFDLDKQDSLFYDLHSHEGVFEVNSLTGLLKTKKELSESASFELRASVTDKKFITEANLNINVKHLSRDCLANSLFVKFNLWPASGKSSSSSEDYDTVSNDELATSAQNELTIEKFISFGYLKRFKDTIDRLVSTQKLSKANESAKLEVVIISLKLSQAKAEEMYEQEITGSLVELIFAVRKNSTSETDSCLNGESISKMLNKRKSILVKKMKTLTNQLRLSQALASTVPFKLKIIDLIFNRECSSIKKAKQVSICTTNIALQHCRLQFNGYNEHSSMCEQQLKPALNKCSLLPKHNWMCEQTQTILNSQKSNDTIIEMDILYETKKVESTTTTETPKNESKPKNTPTSLSDTQLQKYGQSCRKPYNPCKNNAICKQVKVTSLKAAKSNKKSNIKIKIHCFCPNGFKGRFCEEDIDECNEQEQLLINEQLNSKIKIITDSAKGPCAPNSQCVNTYGSYICNCSSPTSSLCYNSQSVQHSASVSDQYKYSNYHYTIKKGNNYVDDDDESADEVEIVESDSDSSDSSQTFFDTISNSTIRQALFGLFGTISIILIILSLAAAIVCRVNMKRNRSPADRSLYANPRYRQTESVIVGENGTSNCSGDQDVFSSSTASSPGSFKLKNNNNSSSEQSEMPDSSKKSKKAFNMSRFTRSKQRSSQTASLLSSTNGCSAQSSFRNKKSAKKQAKENKLGLLVKCNESEEANKKKFNINNLLFAKLNNSAPKQQIKKETIVLVNNPSDGNNKLSSSSQGSSSICESLDTSSAAHSPLTLVTNAQAYETLKKKQYLKHNLSVVESTLLLDAAINNDETDNQIKKASLVNHRSDNDADNDDDDEEEDNKAEQIYYQSSTTSFTENENGLIKIVNKYATNKSNYSSDLTSFGTLRKNMLAVNSSSKFNTLNSRTNEAKVESIGLQKYNTLSKANSKSSIGNYSTVRTPIKKQTSTSTFQPNKANGAEQYEKEECLNGNEDCSQGKFV